MLKYNYNDVISNQEGTSNHLGPSEPLILRVVHRKMGKLEMRGVRLRDVIWHRMTVGRCKVVQNNRMNKLRRRLVLLVPKMSVTKVVRQSYSLHVSSPLTTDIKSQVLFGAPKNH